MKYPLMRYPPELFFRVLKEELPYENYKKTRTPWTSDTLETGSYKQFLDIQLLFIFWYLYRKHCTLIKKLTQIINFILIFELIL